MQHFTLFLRLNNIGLGFRKKGRLEYEEPALFGTDSIK